MDGLLWSIIGISALFVPLTYILGRRLGKYTSLLALIPLAYTTLILLTCLPKVVADGSILETFIWIPEVRFGLLVDGLSLPIALTVALLSTLLVPYSIPYMEHKVHEEYKTDNKRAYATFYALYLLFAIGMLGVALSTSTFEFFLFYELMIVPSWALINVYGYHGREKVALMFFLWMEASALILLVGILTGYARIGNFEISQLKLLNGDVWALWVVISVLAGFLIKMATFGLHIWLPYAHAEAPTPISALLSPAMIGLAAYAIVRMLIPIDAFSSISWLVLLWALITMLYGGLMAFAENDFKRLLAYSSISQMGYLLFGVASYTTLGVSGSMLHYVSHGLGKAILFSVAGAIIYRTGIRDIRQLGGLAAKMPILGIVSIIGFITIGGVPPTVGFVSKLLIFTGGFEHGLHASPFELALAFAAMITTTLTIAYAFWAIRRIFYGALPARFNGVKEAPLLMTVPLLVLSTLSLVLCFYTSIIVDPLTRIVSSLIRS